MHGFAAGSDTAIVQNTIFVGPTSARDVSFAWRGRLEHRSSRRSVGISPEASRGCQGAGKDQTKLLMRAYWHRTCRDEPCWLGAVAVVMVAQPRFCMPFAVTWLVKFTETCRNAGTVHTSGYARPPRFRVLPRVLDASDDVCRAEHVLGQACPCAGRAKR